MTRTILPHQLPQALDIHPDAALLSLDCFDTLLWRDVHAPADLFELLGDITSDQRKRGEQAARKARLLAHHASSEVTLREIYAELLSHADETTREAAVAHELAVEMRHCFAFAPTVALMREAKRRGLPVIIVSDTYFERDQLDALIRAAAGDAVADLIDGIFCSCEHRSAKGENLFATVLDDIALAPDRILHIGDNPRADRDGAERHGLTALHLEQFIAATEQRLRQEGVAGALLGGTGPAWQPHRATLASGEPQIADAGEALGFGVLGPVLTDFADWVAAETRELADRNGGRVHTLFLMRDGHLPREVFAARHPDVVTHAIEISRFAATAASLGDEAAVHRFVLEEVGDGVGTALLRQLLIDGQEAKSLLARLPRHDRARALADAVVSPRWMTKTTTRGRAYAERLIAHLRRRCDIAPGDTLLLVDLGYNGSVQNRIAALLGRELGVQVAGRYLILDELEPTGLDKRGYVDRSLVDAQAVTALTTSVAVLEQFCTVAQGSVVDYRADGTPIRAVAGTKGQQNAVRDTVQAGAIAFARQAGEHIIRAAPAAADVVRRGALATLGRLLFLPLPRELDLIRRFEHDSNLGTDEMVALFDGDIAAQGLRERGMFYLKNARRMFLPAELRGQGLPTSLTLLAQRRFGLDLRYADFCDTRLTLPVLVADGSNTFVDTVEAMPTHDGYFVAAVPVGACRYTIGLQFGRLYDYVQIESVRFLPVGAFLAGEGVSEAFTRPALPSAEGMDQVAPHLFRCAGADSFLMVPPPAPIPERPDAAMMLTVVFRPIALREHVTAPVARSQEHAA